MNIADFYSMEFWNSDWDECFNEVSQEGVTVIDNRLDDFDPEEYLKRGEVITNCAKEKNFRHVDWSTDVFKAVCNKASASKKGKEKEIYVERKIAEKVIRPICEKIAEDGMNIGVYDYSKFLALFVPGVNIRIEGTGKGSYEEKIIKSICRHHKREDIVVVKAAIYDERMICLPLNDRLTSKQNLRFYYLRAYSRATMQQVADMGMLFSEYVIVSEVVKYLRALPEESKAEDRIWCYLQWKFLRRIQLCINNGVLMISDELFRVQEFMDYIRSEGFAYQRTFDDGHSLKMEDLAEFVFMADSKIEGVQYPLILAKEIFYMIMEEYEKDIQTQNFLTDVSTRAAAWQTKKNIPYKIVEDMQNSGFNDFFGYVEFDEDVDINLMKEIEKEWRAIQTIFQEDKHNEVALRFRKLGNHHATGLYFPQTRCLCVDLRYPSSMVHEYFHMLDFLNGSLSRTESFKVCEVSYTIALSQYIDSLDKDNPIRKQWFGNTKCNRSYYLVPTEIFARCGEMYMVRVLGVSNSLCRPEKGFDYPNNPDLMRAIKEYFDKLIYQDQEGGREAAARRNEKQNKY